MNLRPRTPGRLTFTLAPTQSTPQRTERHRHELEWPGGPTTVIRKDYRGRWIWGGRIPGTSGEAATLKAAIASATAEGAIYVRVRVPCGGRESNPHVEDGGT